MKDMFNNYLVIVGKSFLSMFTLLFLFTIFSYFNLISNNILNLLLLVMPIIVMFISGIITGKKSDSKAYLNGFLISFIVVLIFFLIGLITNALFNYKSFIYFLIIISTTILGSIIGINTSSKKIE